MLGLFLTIERANTLAQIFLAINTLYDAHVTRIRNRRNDERAERELKERDAEMDALRARVAVLETKAKG